MSKLDKYLERSATKIDYIIKYMVDGKEDQNRTKEVIKYKIDEDIKYLEQALSEVQTEEEKILKELEKKQAEKAAVLEYFNSVK